MNSKKKIIITSIICVLSTFLLTSAMYLFIGGNILTNLSAQSGNLPLLNEVEAYLEAMYIGEVDKDKMYQYAAKGMAKSVDDPYTNYYTPDEFKEYIEGTTGEYVGVGIVISKSAQTNELIVVMPYENAPGDKAGILPGDIITSIDGKSYTGDMLDEAADALRGEGVENPKGTTVDITIKRGEQTLSKTLTREEVHLTTVSAKMMESDIGYVRIISFDSDTDVELEEKINVLSNQGMKKLIIDLRDNGGGDFNTALRVAGKFLDEGKLIVYTEDKHQNRDDFISEGKMCDNEIILLINENSASASEVLTGALRDNDRTKSIVGTKSFGKGITQNIYDIKNGGGISITVDKYFTPSGECIHEKGILPDVEIKLENTDKLSTELTYEEDLQLQKAVELFR